MVLALCFSSSFRFSWADTAGDSDFVPLDVVSVSYSFNSFSTDSDFTECDSFLSEDGYLVFEIPASDSVKTRLVSIRIKLAPDSVVPAGSYLVYEAYNSVGSSYAFKEYYTSDGFGTDFDSLTATPRSSSYSPSGSVDVYSGQFGYEPSLYYDNSLVLFCPTGSSTSSPEFMLSRFCLSTKPYYDGAFDPQPGWDEEDGWLGSLIKAIIEGIQKIINGITNLPENIANAVKGFFDMVVNAIVQLGQTIIDGLKSLFIPSDGYFESVVNDLSSFFSDRLGLLLYPFDFLISLGDRIAGLETSEPTCTIPEIAYTDSDDNKYVLIEGQTLNVYDLVGRNDIIVGMHQTYLTVMDGIIAFTLLSLCWKRFDHIIGGGAE